MIIDRVERIGLYRGISTYFATAVEFIENLGIASLSPGDFAISGKDVYGFCREFPLKPEGDVDYESHTDYIDIQCVLRGCETILYANTEGLTVKAPYDPEKDIAFYGDAGCHTRLTLFPGDFAVFFPGDAHKPCCKAGGCGQSLKLVVKVALG